MIGTFLEDTMSRRSILTVLLTSLLWATAGVAQSASVADPVRGDVNRDGKITALDALSVLSASVGKPLPAGYTLSPNGDADADGEVSAFDALVILGYVVNKDVSAFPVGRPLVRISVDQDSVALRVGESRTVRVEVRGGPASSLTWRSANPAVASVEGGVIQGRSAGTTLVTVASSTDSMSRATVKVAVSRRAPATVQVGPGPVMLNALGATSRLSASVLDDAGTAIGGAVVTWSSSDERIARVAADGTVTAVANGSATVTASVGPASGAVAVEVRQSVAALRLLPASPSLVPGATLQFAPSAADANGNAVAGTTFSWSSSSTGVARVDANGLLTAVAAGNATITVAAEGRTATAAVTVASAPVSAVKLSPSALALQPGQTAPLTATTLDAGGSPLTGRSVTWITSAAAVATVNASGIVSAVAPGTAVVTATSEGRSASVTVTVSPPAVGSVALSRSTVSLEPGETVSVAATVLDASGGALAGRAVSWSSSAPGVARVSESGAITGVAAGSAQVTATSEGKSAAVAVTVVPPVASITLSSSTLNIERGQVATLTATLYDEFGAVLSGRPVTWTSEGPTVATVDASGNVTGVGVGTTQIVAAAGSKTRIALVQVSAPVGSVEVSPNTLSLTVGQTSQLGATVRDVSGQALPGTSVTWSSSNTAAATVNSSGLVTAAGAGSAVVTATSGGKSGSVTVQVAGVSTPVAVSTVTLSTSSASLTVGQTATLVATPRDASGNALTGRVVTWTSSNSSVASVSSAGVVTAVAAGSATVTATSENRSASASVTVTTVAPVAVASLVLSPASASVQVGSTTTLTATPRDEAGNTLSGRTIAWSTSNAAVATVSPAGVVSGLAAGTATITATSEGKSASAVVTVSTAPPAPVASVAVSPAAHTFTALGQTLQLGATVLDSQGQALAGRAVTWSTSNAAAADVDATGRVTAKALGSAVVTGTVEGKSAAVQVTVNQVPSTLQINPNAVSFGAIGESMQLSASLSDANGHSVSGCAVAWTSHSTNVVTVNSLGSLLSKAVGTALVTAACSGVADTVSVTVSQLVASVSVSPATPSVTAGGTTTLSATALDSKGVTVPGATFVWSSSNPSVATVSGSGLVSAVTAGTASITASSGGKSASANLTVNTPAPAAVATVALSPGSVTLDAGKTATVTATLKDAAGNVLTGRSITWSSSNSGVATVSASGVVTAVASGSATVTATSDGKSATMAVTVTTPVTNPPVQGGKWNEPSGLTPLLHANGTTTNLGSSLFYGAGWTNPSRLAVVADAEAPNGSALEFRWPQGHGDGSPAMAAWSNWGSSPGPQSELYFRVVVKWSPNWDFHTSGTSKIWYFGMAQPGYQATKWFIGWQAQDERRNAYDFGPPGYFLAVDQSEAPPVQYGQEAGKLLAPGQYYVLEVWLKAQSAGNVPDGEIKMWLDGKQLLHRTGQNFLPLAGGDARFNGVQLYPYWGGTGDTKKVDDWMRWGEFYMAGKK